MEKYIPRMNAGLEKATPSAMPVQPRTRAGRSNEGACPTSSSCRPTSLYKFVSHTLGLTHKLVIDGGCTAPSTGRANCQLSHSNPGIDFHSILHASGGGGAALQPEPIVHSLTTQGVTLDVAMAPRIRRTRLSDYLPWSQAWVVYFEATVRYHPHLLPHLCSEAFCGATPGGPWSVIFGRVSRSGSRSGTRDPSPLRAPAVQPSPPQWPWRSPGDIPRAFSSARRFGSSIAPPSAPRRGPTAPCAWFWICPRLEEPRLIRAFPERGLRYGIPPWVRPWPLCAAWGGTRLWRKRISAPPSASALCGPRIGRSYVARGKGGYTSTSGSPFGPALPPSFLLSSRRRFTGLPHRFAGAAASSITSMIIFWRGPPVLRAPTTCKISRTSAATSVSPSRRRSWFCRHAASSSWASACTPLFRRCASLQTHLHGFAIACPRGGRGRNAPSGSCCR